jgi:multidrug resistance efflux pump
MLKPSWLTIILLMAAAPVHAQDVPGIEICTAERDMARRTGCLQANISYLHKLITKNNAAAQQQLAAANAEIAALKASIAALKASVKKLQAAGGKPDAIKASSDKPERK